MRERKFGWRRSHRCSRETCTGSGTEARAAGDERIAGSRCANRKIRKRRNSILGRNRQRSG